MSNSNKAAIIGIGNPLRKDDGIGIAVLGALRKAGIPQNIELLDFGTASFDLVSRIKEYDSAVIVDGISAGIEPGEMRVFDLSRASAELGQAPVSTHEINLAGLSELLKNLQVRTKVVVAGIQVADTDFGEGLSPELLRGIPGYVEEISSLPSLKA